MYHSMLVYPYLWCQLLVCAITGIHMRPVPTKWETSHKISFPSYYHIHVVHILSFKMICNVRVAASFRVQNLLFPSETPLFSIDFWHVQWAISPLVPWRLVAHFVRTGLILLTSREHYFKNYTAYPLIVVIKLRCGLFFWVLFSKDMIPPHTMLVCMKYAAHLEPDIL